MKNIESELRSCLESLPNVDRIAVRAKELDSFTAKAMAKGSDGVGWKYAHPFEQIEDQVAGRVLVFFRSDIGPVVEAITTRFKKAELQHKAPPSSNAFGYETTHVVCSITPDLGGRSWSAVEEPATTFELQVRTLAQHAWSEPQHGFYKNRGRGGLSEGFERSLYWAAASAWGIDSIWESLREELEKLDQH